MKTLPRGLFFFILQQNNNCFPLSAVTQLEPATKKTKQNKTKKQKSQQRMCRRPRPTDSHNNSHRGRSRESFHGRGGASFRERQRFVSCAFLVFSFV